MWVLPTTRIELHLSIQLDTCSIKGCYVRGVVMVCLRLWTLFSHAARSVPEAVSAGGSPRPEQ